MRSRLPAPDARPRLSSAPQAGARSSSPLAGAGLAAALLALSGCSAPDQPISDPAPAASPTQAGAPDEAPPVDPAPSTPEAPPEARPAPRRGPRDIVIRQRGFPKHVLELRPGDLVEVDLNSGGVARGRVRSVSPYSMALASGSESAIVTRLKPSEVAQVRLIDREEPLLVAVTGDAPRTPEETWLERFAPSEILGKEPKELWKGRFDENQILEVTRPCKLEPLAFVKLEGKPYFLRQPNTTVLNQRDAIKLMGVTLGYERGLDGREVCLGEVYLYLVRRGEDAFPLFTLDRMHPGDLDGKSLETFLEQERVTVVVLRPNDPSYLKISRVPARIARIYRQHLEATPDRPAVRRLRARKHDALKDAEQRVRAMYKAVGLGAEADLEQPLVISFRVPSAEEGGIHLLPYSKEIGLD